MKRLGGIKVFSAIFQGVQNNWGERAANAI